mmetsp:Transcript_25314/g.74079  ORF Transcript_25314/g.74079 Transcript_25314/m.74079 type:complete len:197 (-) Transcript_25314:499-1089(-)
MAPPPWLPGAPVVEALNTRFATAVASNKLSETGVLLHQWDETEEPGKLWRGCPTGGGSCAINGRDWGGWWSCSIIYGDMLMRRYGSPIKIFTLGGDSKSCRSRTDASSALYELVECRVHTLDRLCSQRAASSSSPHRSLNACVAALQQTAGRGTKVKIQLTWARLDSAVGLCGASQNGELVTRGAAAIPLLQRTCS